MCLLGDRENIYYMEEYSNSGTIIFVDVHYYLIYRTKNFIYKVLDRTDALYIKDLYM